MPPTNGGRSRGEMAHHNVVRGTKASVIALIPLAGTRVSLRYALRLVLNGYFMIVCAATGARIQTEPQG